MGEFRRWACLVLLVLTAAVSGGCNSQGGFFSPLRDPYDKNPVKPAPRPSPWCWELDTLTNVAVRIRCLP
jgi:hypothetical protein